MSDKTISVSWPPLALGTAGWINRLEDLAADAERLVGRTVGLQQTAELGLALVGLIWPALSAETVAASCRASALLKMPILMSTAPADQVQEVAERLDAIYAAAQVDPAAALVEVAPPLLQRVAPPGPRTGKKLRKAEPDVEPEFEPVLPVMPDEVVMPDESAAMPDVVVMPEEVVMPEIPPVMPDVPAEMPEVVAEPPAPPAPAADTTGWWLAADVAELLGISQVTVSRWRLDGRLGAEGQAWLPSGRSFAFEPNQIELLMDQLAAKKQANTERTHRRIRITDQRPDGWLTCDEFARAAGISESKARALVRYDKIPAEMVLRKGRRSQWINPAAVELWRRSA